MTRRGFGLVATLLVVSVLGLFAAGVLTHATVARERVAQRKYQLQAQALARSGLEYARAMIVHGRWRSSTRFVSRDLGGGSFQVEASPAGGAWQVRSLGSSGTVRCSLESRLP